MRDGGEGQLTDLLLGSVVEAVRPGRSDGHGESWRLLTAHHDQIKDWLDPTDDPRMLGRFGGYEIVGIIGQGGMGRVFAAEQDDPRRTVCLAEVAESIDIGIDLLIREVVVGRRPLRTDFRSGENYCPAAGI